jgi:acetylornithine/succinyldiaminopimelate/putrescine aminotransferase
MKLRERFGFIIVSNCIQCGFGRTGKTFGHDHIGLMPDIIVAAKAIGGGLPLGALLVKEKYANVFKLGKHGTTFGGNSVCCAAGNVVLEEVFERGLLNTVKKNGDYFKNKLLALKEKYPDKIADVRGKGYMLGVELKFPGASVVDEMFKRKILTNCTNNTVIRILPPLIAGMKEIDIFLAAFEEVIRDMKF